MFQLFRILHIIGVAMFFGSVLGHAVTTLIPGAADNPPAMLAARQAIVLANWYVTIPGLLIVFVSGGLMIATRGYEKRRAFVVHILAAVLIAGVATTILIPAAVGLQEAAKAIAAGSAARDAFAHLAMREHLYGAVNILLAVVAIGAGAILPNIRAK